MEDQSEKYIKKYLIAYINPNTKETEIINLHSTTLRDAMTISSCMFGKFGPKHLFYKKVQIE